MQSVIGDKDSDFRRCKLGAVCLHKQRAIEVFVCGKRDGGVTRLGKHNTTPDSRHTVNCKDQLLYHLK